MRLTDIIFFSLSVVFFIIGVHQTFILGLLQSYWLFMLSVSMLLLYKLKRRKPESEPGQANLQKPLVSAKKNKTIKVKPRK
jgi:hypothetical protein